MKNALLWSAQGILAATFLWAGCMKIALPAKLPFPWVKDHAVLAFLTGIIDLAGGMGIILPSLLHLRPRLTFLAACGIMVLMAAACIFHILRGEVKDIGFNVLMAVLAAFVARGRQGSR